MLQLYLQNERMSDLVRFEAPLGLGRAALARHVTAALLPRHVGHAALAHHVTATLLPGRLGHAALARHVTATLLPGH